MTTSAEVLTELLAAEHAAVYAYGVLTAKVSDAQRSATLAAYDAHRLSRDSLLVRLQARGLATPGPLPAYDARPLTRAAALTLALHLETGLAVLWHDLIATTEPSDLDLRRLGLRQLSDCAVRATGWRGALGQSPTTVALPGQV